MPAQPILSVDEFPITDGSTACIPLIAQIMADTTGLDLETARSAVTTNTTAQAWRNLGLYGNNYGDSVKLIIAYEAPESVKEELKADGDPLEQKAIGRDALVFIVNEDNPVQSLTRQQLKDIYAGAITNWKDVGGKDQEIIAFQRRADSGSQTLFQKLLIQDGPLMEAPPSWPPPPWVSWWTALQSITTPPTPSVSRSTTTSTRCTPSPVCGCWPWMA